MTRRPVARGLVPGSPAARGLLWALAAGANLSLLNALLRLLTQTVDPLQAQFLRYFCGGLVLLPLVAASGWRAWWPRNLRGQFARGALHSIGLWLWFAALPRMPLADMTAISFTGPIFVMVGARVFFGEAMRWERWLATAMGLAGVLIVVGPRLSAEGGAAHALAIASAAVFAGSFLLTKALTRSETNGVILAWQSVSVALFSLPLALWHWQPLSAGTWAAFFGCGLLGSMGHWCLTQSLRVAEVSATQSARFVDLLWAALMGWLLFGDRPAAATLGGGMLIAAATLWVARREGRRDRQRAATLAAETDA